jgi:hypothetical protein
VQAHPLGLGASQRPGLIEDRRRHPVHADVVDQGGTAQGRDLPVRQPAQPGGGSGQLGHSTGVTCPGRGPQIGEVGHRLQSRVEFTLAQVAAQSRFGLDQRRALGDGVHVCEHIAGRPAEQVDHLGAEVLAPPGPGHLDGCIDAARPVEHLDGVGEVEQPHRPRDLLTAQAVGHSRGLPAREDLPQRIAHFGGEPKPVSHLRRGQAVRHQPPLHRPASGQDQIGGQAKPVQEWGSGPGVAEREAIKGSPARSTR